MSSPSTSYVYSQVHNQDQRGSPANSGPPSEFIGPVTPPTEVPGSPDVLVLHGGSLIASSAIRHVQRVSKQAALNTKKQIWDSNDASIVAAQSAVDQWEHGYNALRDLLGAIGDSAQGLYGATKTGVSGLEHSFLRPVRDWILLPAFGGLEKAAGETVAFLQSSHARQLAHQSLDLARQVPFVGENILAPALCIGAEALQRTWKVVQYPIPSPSQVRDSVDFVMTGTKWALSIAGREIFLYVRRADANITRSLSHTQWKVLGSGPYATLDKLNKLEVIDHLCERYFSLTDAVARYELAAHIRAHNRPLYHDLVLTGLLRERGGDLTSDDEWLSSCPSYRDSEAPFLLQDDGETDLFPLWFRLPNENGKRPRPDAPWVMFDEKERRKLESFYRDTLKKHQDNKSTLSTGSESVEANPLQLPQPRYATNAKWYDPDPVNDLFLDQKRHAVSSFSCCPNCRIRHDLLVQPPKVRKQFGELCDQCGMSNTDAPWVDTLLSPPPLVSIYRPTMWRFYGPGDELRRSTWFLDTKRYGLQPYGEDAQAVLEDAYLFLKWTASRRNWDGSVLLTVEVPSPDGSEKQLVQFSSLTSATAIGKGLASAIALFKRRVYRGVYHAHASSRNDDIDGLQTSKIPKSTDNLSTMKGENDPLDTVSPEDLANDQSDSGSETSRGNESTICSMESPSKYARTPGDHFIPHDLSSIMNVSHEISEADLSEMVDLAETAVVGTMNLYSDELKHLRLRLSSPVDERLSLAYPLKATDVTMNTSKRRLPKEDNDDDVDHLVLIVHGIGEMLQSIDLFGLSKLPTIVDCCGFLRKNHSEVLDVRVNQLSKKLDLLPGPRNAPGRVEYLPIEWHDSLTIQSQRRPLESASPTGPMDRNYTINDISLRTIPQLRQFANDTLMDVLFFVSPKHHDVIIDIVVTEMNFVVERFRAITGYKGNVSLVGHSLGSIISWDILDNQRGFMESLTWRERPMSRRSSSVSGMPDTPEAESEQPCDSEPVSPEECRSDPVIAGKDAINEKEESSSNSERESMPEGQPDYPQLAFKVDNAFMLGSPIAVFLMIRDQRRPLTTDYKLSGCSHIFNIFHPYDPVAYRIEPLLDPRNADIEAKIMTHWHGGFRFQYQTKLLWKRIVEETIKTQENVVAKLESGMAALGLLDGAIQDADEDDDYPGGARDLHHKVVTGALNRGHRIDYMLQEKELETANEYVAALAAHSCYWLEKDLSLFIARQICRQALDREKRRGR